MGDRGALLWFAQLNPPGQAGDPVLSCPPLDDLLTVGTAMT